MTKCKKCEKALPAASSIYCYDCREAVYRIQTMSGLDRAALKAQHGKNWEETYDPKNNEKAHAKFAMRAHYGQVMSSLDGMTR